MAPKSWTTSPQQAYLLLQMPDYIHRQAQKKLYLFWGPMQEGFFARFPEHAVLGLPSPSDATAPPLTEEQLATLGKAITMRKAQLTNWYRRERKKIRAGTAAASPMMQPLTQVLIGRTRPRGRRVHQPVEIFQKRNKDQIQMCLAERGHNAMNEAARRQERDEGDEETREEQETQVKMSRAERMRLRISVVSELWAGASEEERADVHSEVAREREALKREQQRIEEASGTGEKRTPEQYQFGVDGIDELFEKALKIAGDTAGWVGISIVGGPNPRRNGDLAVKVVCSGETPAGNNFQEACQDFEKAILEPFQLFLQRVYTVSQRRERAIEAAPVPAVPVPTRRGDDAPGPPPKPMTSPLATSPLAQTTTGPLTPPSTRSTTTPPTQPVALATQPARVLSLSTASSVSTIPFSYTSADWSPQGAVGTTSPTWSSARLPPQGQRLDYEFSEDFLAKLGPFDNGMEFGGDDPFSVPHEGTEPAWTTWGMSQEGVGAGEDAEEANAGLMLAVVPLRAVPRPAYNGAKTVTATDAFGFPTTTSTSSFIAPDRRAAAPASLFAPTALSTFPTPQSSTSSFTHLRPSTASTTPVIHDPLYAPSVLFQAFHSTAATSAPITPGVPASMKRKTSGWTSPGHTTPEATRTATVLTSILGAASGTTSHTTATISMPAPAVTTVTPVPVAFDFPASRPETRIPAPPQPKRAPAVRKPKAATAATTAMAPAPVRRGRPPKAVVDAQAAGSALADTTNSGVAGVPPAVGTMRFNREVEARQAREADAKAAAEKAKEVKEAVGRGYFELPNAAGNTPITVLTARKREPRRMDDGSVAERQVKNVRPRNPNAATEEALLARTGQAPERMAAGDKRKRATAASGPKKRARN